MKIFIGVLLIVLASGAAIGGIGWSKSNSTAPNYLVAENINKDDSANKGRKSLQLETFQLNSTGTPDMSDTPVTSDSCTLTIGFWKTHAGFGPQPDEVSKLLPVWLGTPGKSKSVQVATAAQAVALLNKSGDASNGINKLYAQLLGAKFNMKSGAGAGKTTIAPMDTFLGSYNAADWPSLNISAQQQVIEWAAQVDLYNNGKLGPPHCE